MPPARPPNMAIMYEKPTHRPTWVGATSKSTAATGASTEGTASAIAVSDCTARVTATAATSRTVPSSSPPLKCGDFDACSLRAALELVAEGQRVLAGVGPYQAMIRGGAGGESAGSAAGRVALEIDDFPFILMRELEVHGAVGAKLVEEALPVGEREAFFLRFQGDQRLGHDSPGGVLSQGGRGKENCGADNHQPSCHRHERSPDHPSRIVANSTPGELTGRECGFHGNSKSPAAPMPPPMHIVTTTCLTPRRLPSMSAWPVRRAPEAP